MTKFKSSYIATVSTFVLVGALLLAGTAVAQQALHYVPGVGYVLDPPSNPDYSFLHDAGKQQMENAGRTLGAMLGGAVQGKKLISAILTVKCEYFTQLIKVYADGTTETKAIELPVNRSELVAAQAASHGAISTIETGCPNQ